MTKKWRPIRSERRCKEEFLAEQDFDLSVMLMATSSWKPEDGLKAKDLTAIFEEKASSE